MLLPKTAQNIKGVLYAQDWSSHNWGPGYNPGEDRDWLKFEEFGVRNDDPDYTAIVIGATNRKTTARRVRVVIDFD